ncbi:hypothetical protein RIF29_00017 [Crotalaria pallida]|uniref:Probable purine permease n=1 Tax=Crotalaria pallida TaxID=3830 RepID=A0AAN9IVT4_CROPI
MLKLAWCAQAQPCAPKRRTDGARTRLHDGAGDEGRSGVVDGARKVGSDAGLGVRGAALLPDVSSAVQEGGALLVQSTHGAGGASPGAGSKGAGASPGATKGGALGASSGLRSGAPELGLGAPMMHDDGQVGVASNTIAKSTTFSETFVNKNTVFSLGFSTIITDFGVGEGGGDAAALALEVVTMARAVSGENCTILAIGATSAPLMFRLYFTHDSHCLWLSGFLQVSGFPIMLLPLSISYICCRRAAITQTTKTKMVLMELPLFLCFAVIGLIIGANTVFYAYGSSRLPVSTSSLILASQLAFNAVSSFFLVKQGLLDDHRRFAHSCNRFSFSAIKCSLQYKAIRPPYSTP